MSDAKWPGWTAIVGMALAFMQTSMASVLLVWGRGWLLGRGFTTIALIAAAGYVSAGCTSDSVDLWIGIMSAIAGIVASPFIIARLAGFVLIAQPTAGIAPRALPQFSTRQVMGLTVLVAAVLGVSNWFGESGGPIAAAIALVMLLGLLPSAYLIWSAGKTLGPSAASPIPDSPVEARQFTLLSLLSLTTVAGAAFGVARYLDFPWDEIGKVAMFMVALGAIPWTAIPLALGCVRLWIPLAATAVVCPLVGWAISKTGFPPEHPGELIAMTCLQGSLTLGICAVVRLAGYRLAWPL